MNLSKISWKLISHRFAKYSVLEQYKMYLPQDGEMSSNQVISCQETPPFESKSGENKGGFPGYHGKPWRQFCHPPPGGRGISPDLGSLFERFPLKESHFRGLQTPKNFRLRRAWTLRQFWVSEILENLALENKGGVSWQGSGTCHIAQIFWTITNILKNPVFWKVSKKFRKVSKFRNFFERSKLA